MKNLLIVFLSTSLCVSCATTGQTRNAYMAGGFAAGAVIGATTAPSDEKPEGHAMLWGGVIAAIVGFAANYFINDSKKVADLENKVYELENKPAFIKTKEKEGYFTDPFTKTKEKITWEIKEGSQWVDEGPDERYHINIRAKKKKKASGEK